MINVADLCNSDEARRRLRAELLIKALEDATVRTGLVFLSVIFEPSPNFGGAETPILLHQLNRYDRNGPHMHIFGFRHWPLSAVAACQSATQRHTQSLYICGFLCGQTHSVFTENYQKH